MQIYGKYQRALVDERGNVELTIKIENYHDKYAVKELEHDVPYRISFTVAKSSRSIEQNKFMWEVIHEIAVARGGPRSNDDYDIYIEALQRAGAKFEYIATLPEAEPILKSQFRAIKLMNQFEHNGKTFNQYKVYYGSSKMDKAEMTMLIETVLDMAAQEGIAPVEFDY